MNNLLLTSSNSGSGSMFAMIMAMLGSYALLIIILVAVILVPIIIIEYIIPAIALSKMAKLAGYKYPWLAYIPFAQTYLEFVLPKREFNLGFKTKERGTVGLISIGTTIFGGVVVGALNTIPFLGQFLDMIFPILLQILNWRKMYDVMRTYKDREISLVISIVGAFIPIVYSCALLSCITQEPEYGWGGYYSDETRNVTIN